MGLERKEQLSRMGLERKEKVSRKGGKKEKRDRDRQVNRKSDDLKECPCGKVWYMIWLKSCLVSPVLNLG